MYTGITAVTLKLKRFFHTFVPVRHSRHISPQNQGQLHL
nr:MAG TPA: hypothetical protein [Caudoviricetes sp.]